MSVSLFKHLCSCREEKPESAFALNNKTCKSAGGKCSRIDIDPIGPDLGPLIRRMAVNDDLPEIHCAGEKFFPDPQKVIVLLAL